MKNYFTLRSFNYRAVANGPVGPAMAGPIIEPGFFFFFLKFLLYFLAGIIIEPGFFRYYFLNRDDTVVKMCTLTIRF